MSRLTNKSQVRRVNISDVARMAGVSKTTVSRYLAGNIEALSNSTYEKIRETVEILGYQPNRMARALKDGRSHLIGMIVADITNPFSTAILRGAEDVCNQHSYSLMVCNTDNDPVKERDYILTLQSHRIDGLIINSTGHNNDFLRQLDADDTAIVLVDREIPDLPFDTVGVDNHGVTEQAVKFLLQQKYERIAFFTEPIQGVSSRIDRLSSFQKTLKQHHHENASDVYEVNLHQEGNLESSVRRYLEASQGQFRAIFAVNSVMLLRLSLVLQSLGVNVPQDVALLGFDNPEWAPLVGSGLTTIEQPTYEIGVAAMERVLLRLQGVEESPYALKLPGKMIVRGSTPYRE